MRHLLLIPNESYQTPLLAREPCGGVPSIAWEQEDGTWGTHPPSIDAAGPLDYGLPDPPTRPALALRWEDQPCPLSAARLLAVLNADAAARGWRSDDWGDPTSNPPRLARTAAERGLGTLVEVP